MFDLLSFGSFQSDSLSIFENLEKIMLGLPNQTCQFQVDVRDEGDKYVLEAELSQFDKQDIQLEMEQDLVTIAVEHKEVINKEGEDIVKAHCYGSFIRSFYLPGIDLEKVTTSWDTGVFYVVLPKENPQPLQLEQQ